MGDSDERPIVALLALEDVDWSSDSAPISSLLPTALYAVDIVNLYLGLGVAKTGVSNI